jgi:hypothetical protein
LLLEPCSEHVSSIISYAAYIVASPRYSGRL